MAKPLVPQLSFSLGFDSIDWCGIKCQFAVWMISVSIRQAIHFIAEHPQIFFPMVVHGFDGCFITFFLELGIFDFCPIHQMLIDCQGVVSMQFRRWCGMSACCTHCDNTSDDQILFVGFLVMASDKNFS